MPYSTPIFGLPFNVVTAKSADFTVAVADKGAVFDVTTGAGNITATLPAAATAGNGWYVYLRKADTGAGLILTSPTTNPAAIGVGIQGHMVLLFTDGTNYYYRSMVGTVDSSGNMTFTSPGAISLTASGTNKAITITPTGSGKVNLALGTTASGAALTLTKTGGAANGAFASWTNGTQTGSLENFAGDNGYAIGSESASTPFGMKVGGVRQITYKLASNIVQEIFSNGAVVGSEITAHTRQIKQVSSIADAVATSVLVVTIPNSVQSGNLKVTLTGSLGAGDATGANQSSATAVYRFVITRTAGVAAAFGTSLILDAATATVAGGVAILTFTAAGAMSGAVGAANTLTISATIARTSGASTNHTCLVYAEFDNANASGMSFV